MSVNNFKLGLCTMNIKKKKHFKKDIIIFYYSSIYFLSGVTLSFDTKHYVYYTHDGLIIIV